MVQTLGVEGARLSDQVDLGVLTTVVPRDVVDEAVLAAGKAERRRGGKMPPQVTTYFVMGMALWDGDYAEVWRKLTGILAKWGCYGRDQAKITAGGITQARQRLGEEPVREVFAQVARPVATLDTPGAFLGPWRLVSQDGLEFDLPDTEANAKAFGYPGTRKGAPRAAFPKARAVTIIETGSQAELLAAIGPCISKGSGEQSLARELLPHLKPDWLLLCDRLFYSWKDWRTADGTGAALLWRVKADLTLIPLEFHPDGSYKSVLVSPHVRGRARDEIIEAARAGEELPRDKARYVRAVEYEVSDRGKEDGEGELIALITNILDYRAAPAMALAEAYHQRWEHETSNKQLKTVLRGPAAILRSQSPDLVKQEIWGYFLTHYAISALICRAATAAGIDPDRVKFTRTVRIIRDQARSLAFPP
ncbi:MAG: IS4 family transposase [Streptosporangiaceae bacterium]